MQPQNVGPKVITNIAAISTCETGQQPYTGMGMLLSMQPQNVGPNIITHSAAITTCEKGQQPYTDIG